MVPQNGFTTLIGIITFGITMLGASFADSLFLAQSPARPFGLDIRAKVKPIQAKQKPIDLQTHHQVPSLPLSEIQALFNTSSVLLDPSQIVLNTDWNAQVHLVGEAGGFHNTLGFQVQADTTKTGDPFLIFPDVSNPTSYFHLYPELRPTQFMPDDFVEWGTLPSRTNLDFFLIANGVYSGKQIYSTNRSVNKDGLRQVVSLHTMSTTLINSPYLVLSFEDLWEGALENENDFVFAVDLE